MCLRKCFESRSDIRWWNLMVWVKIVLRGTVGIDWSFNIQSGGHLQSQVTVGNSRMEFQSLPTVLLRLLSPRQWNFNKVKCLFTSSNDFCIDLQICGGRIAQSAVCPLAWWRCSAFSRCTLLGCLEGSSKVQVCVLWSSHQLIWYQFFIFSKP